jgi:NPCBM/NEW2 domain
MVRQENHGSSDRNYLRRPLRRVLVALVALLLPAGRVVAEGTISPVSSDPVFKALMIDGRSPTGRIISFEAAAVTIVNKDGKKEVLPLDQLVKLTRETPSSAILTENVQSVLLADGDRLMRAAIGTTTEASLEVRSETLGKLEIPLDCILGLILSTQGQTGDIDLLREQVMFEPRSSEVVWLSNGDRMVGSFDGMDDRKIKLQIDQKPVQVDRGGCSALGFDPGLLHYTAPKSDFFEVTLNDGTRLGVLSARLVEGNVEAVARFGGRPIRFPITELARIHSRSKNLVYLSQRVPAAEKYVSYIGPTRHYRLDRTVDGHPMQVGGQAYDRGVGTQSRTLLAYTIEPGDRRFQAFVGVDERAGPLGSVVFRVLVDGQEKFRSPPMTDRDAPRDVDVDLTGGKNLILYTDFGERGNVRDLADWVEARLIR